MKIAISAEGKTKESKALIGHLDNLGYIITDFETKTDGQISMQEHIEKIVKNVDIIIVDITNGSFKSGYIVSLAKSLSKVLIVLSKEKTSNSEFVQVDNNITFFVEYGDHNIVQLTESKIFNASKKLDSKFILIISAEIDRYLEWATNTKKMHKAQIVRNAIEGLIKKDTEYKRYIDSL